MKKEYDFDCVINWLGDKLGDLNTSLLYWAKDSLIKRLILVLGKVLIFFGVPAGLLYWGTITGIIIATLTWWQFIILTVFIWFVIVIGVEVFICVLGVIISIIISSIRYIITGVNK